MTPSVKRVTLGLCENLGLQCNDGVFILLFSIPLGCATLSCLTVGKCVLVLRLQEIFHSNHGSIEFAML